MTSNSAPDDISAPVARPARPGRPTSRWAWLLLLAIAVLSAWFNTINLFGWDGGTGQHPDERFMTDVAYRLKLPASLGEYFDSQRNPLNPRNVDKTFYVYGLLPQTLTHLTAVLLTPNAALPPLVAAPSPLRYGKIPPIANPDLRAPKIALLQQWLNPSAKDLTSYYEVYKIGRAWSALFALLSVVMLFLLGRRLYGARVGLLAALLLALAVLPIQIAHFFTVDSATAFFTLLSIYWAVRLAQNGGLGSAAGLGLSIGAAMACRVTMATLGVLAIIALAQRMWLRHEAAETDEALSSADSVYFSPRPRPITFGGAAGLAVLAGFVALLAFRVLQPDAFVGSSFFDVRPEPRFIDNISVVGALVGGQIDTPPSQQWAGRIPYVFSLQNMVVWGLGPLLGLAAWLGWAAAGWQLARGIWLGWSGRGWGRLRRRLAHMLPWFWVAFYFAWQGGQFVMTMRYYLQLYGLLALFAAWGLVRIVDYRAQIADWIRPRSRFYNLQFALRWVPLVLVIGGTLCWAYAFTRIYTRPHSRVAASRWIYEHIPSGSTISSELWDDPLPVFDPRGGLNQSNGYYSIQTQPYDEDEELKYFGSTGANGQHAPGLFDQLDQLDYLILSSNRVYDSATRLPMRYPALTRYYHYLFNGELGFEQVADISSYPTLFGIPIPDQSAEEAFSVYDHPRVLIFKKTAAYSRAKAEQLIAGDVAWGEVYKLATPRASRVPTALRLTQDQWPSYRAGGSWPALFERAPALVARLPWLFWLLALELLGWSMFALLFRVLPRLPDRGFALAKTLGLLAVAYAAWLLGSLKLLPFGSGSVWLCAGLLMLAGVAAAWRARADLRALVRQRSAALLVAEALFVLAYLGFVLIRALNPDLWHPARGGEKAMDLAFLTAVLKSPYFPPYDPWFAGGYMNYQYFGFVLVGALVHMTGIAPATAYNLAVPMLFALTALGAWGVGYNLIARVSGGERQRGREAEREREGEIAVGTRSLSPPLLVRAAWGDRERRAVITGVLAAAFVVLLGPLNQAFWFLPGSATPPSAALPSQCQVSIYAVQQLCRGRPEWLFWDATRLVGMDLGDGTSNEFPFFTFLFGDLHAHMIALPLALAALGLMVAVVRTKNQEPKATSRFSVLGSWFLVLGLLALVIGALRATNSWDYPTYLGLSLAALALLAWRRLQHGARLWPIGLAWLLAALGLTLASRLLFAPFGRSFATDAGGLTIWFGQRTPALDFLKINGVWLFMLWSGTLLLYRRRGLDRLRLGLLGGGALLYAALIAALGLSAPLLLVPLAGLALGALVDLLLEAGTLVGPRAIQRALNRRPVSEAYVQLRLPVGDLDEDADAPDEQRRFMPLAQLLPVLWALAALLLALAAEVVVGRGDVGRINTVLHLGMQSWLLFALASALACGAVWRAAGVATGERANRAARRFNRGWAWRAVALALIAAALAYPLTATPARVADRADPQIAPTLDGMAFMRSAKSSWAENDRQFDFTQDAAAIDWMHGHISGTPIVLEGGTEAYRWGGRVSIYTGLPALLGWRWHELQQRSAAEATPILNSRQALIQQLYASADAAGALQTLRLYGVEYVYVGKLEQALYPAAGLAKFAALARSGQIQQVYAAGDTRIYQVARGTSAPAVLSTTLATRPPTLAAAAPASTPVYAQPAVDEYAWNGLAASQPVAVLLWLLAGYALLALGLPPALLVFGRGHAGAGGYAWARLVGLLLLGYAVWLPVSMGVWIYNRWGLLWGALLIAALDVAILLWAGRRRASEPAPRPARSGLRSPSLKPGLAWLGDYLRTERRSILIVEALFLAAFAFMTVLRAFNPDLWQPAWGGEKPFEFGFLNAILRSPTMPPYDPFLSDTQINYYYYGLFLVSLPVKATGISPAVGFNLIVPTLFAMTLTGAYALVARLTGRARYGLVGGAFVALLGNLAAAFPVGWGQGLAPARDALQAGLGGFGAQLGSWFVGPSRVIEIPDKLLTINEFPFWSYLFADLHPHLIAMPITLLVIAIAFELFEDRRRTTDDGRWTTDDGRWSVVGGRWLLAALGLGALAVTNSWDFPTYALLLGGALAGRGWRERHVGWRAMAGLVIGLLQAGAIGLFGLLLYLPFFQSFQRPAGVTGIGLVRDGSPVGMFVLIYGLYLLILGLWVAGVAARLLRGARASVAPADRAVEQTHEGSTTLGIVAGPPSSVGRRPPLLLAAWVALGLLLVIAIGQPQALAALWSSALLLKLGLLALLVVGVRVLLARRLPARVWFVVWLAVLGWAVSFGVELIYIRDHLDGGEAYRMNTVFKFGLQAWILLALAAAAALPWLARGLRRAGAAAQALGWALIGALVALALVFPLVGIPSRLAFRFPDTPGVTLDGLAFLDRAVYSWNDQQIALRYDADAIRWLNANIRGTPIVLQSSLEFYRAYGVRIAANTGLPTIVSPLHANEQHDPGEVAARDFEVQQIYGAPDREVALELLKKYHVGYVYVGAIERAAYGEVGVAKFDQMVGSDLKLAYQNAGVKIYQVSSSVADFGADASLPPGQPQQPQSQADQRTLATLEQQVGANPTAAEPAFRLGQRYRELQRLDDAARVLKTAAQSNPQHVALHHLWGDVLRDAGRVAEAEAAYRAAIAAEPNAGNYNKLGVELARWGKLDQAAEAFTQAIAADASATAPHYHLGEVYEQQGLAAQAIAQYQEYLARAPANDIFYADATAALERMKK